jgi:hypothetical protein
MSNQYVPFPPTKTYTCNNLEGQLPQCACVSDKDKESIKGASLPIKMFVGNPNNSHWQCPKGYSPVCGCVQNGSMKPVK